MVLWDVCRTVKRCSREMIPNGFRHCDILRSHSFQCVTSSQHYVMQLGETLKWSASAGTFGQSESWSIHISSSWKHPAVPYEVLIDPLSVPDCDVLNFKTDVSDAINAGKAETRGGEPKVSCIASQMIFWVLQAAPPFLSIMQKLNSSQPCLLLLGLYCSLRYTVSQVLLQHPTTTHTHRGNVGELNPLQQHCTYAT